MPATRIRIDFEPVGRRVEVERDTTVLQAAHLAGIEIIAICGGMGTCERCQVQVVNGALSPITAVEENTFSPHELGSGWRLACQAEMLSSGTLYIPPGSLTTPQRLQLEGVENGAFLDHLFQPIDLEVTPPALEDLRSDAVRLQDALQTQGSPVDSIRYPLLAALSEQLRAWGWKLRTIVREREICAVLPAGTAPLGLAVDIGTTKVAAYLVDLESGEILGRQSAMNPQIHFGEDVISRIFFCMEHPAGRAELQARMVKTLNELAAAMCAACSRPLEHIVEAVVVGNTAMHHLFAGLPVQQLGLLPFVPAVSEPLEFPAREIGLHLAPAASVYLPANIAGYVGADHVAMVLATGAYGAQDTVVAVDIGTNTEISLVHHGRILCCSCASGPAFEGAHIREGMRAAEGAIERVQIAGETIHLYTVGGQPPVGICGSGILDAIAEMTRSGVLNRRGILLEHAPGVQGSGRHSHFVLAAAEKTGIGRSLTLNRKDIHEVLLAKAAIRTGIEILLLEAGLQAGQIERLIVAGAFGTYLDLRSAIEIGMFPNLPLERFAQVGNAAGSGARQMLVSAQARQIASAFARRMEYVELTIHPRFKEIFLKTMDVNKSISY